MKTSQCLLVGLSHLLFCPTLWLSQYRCLRKPYTGHLVRTRHEVPSAGLAPDTLKPKAAQLLLPARITAPSQVLQRTQLSLEATSVQRSHCPSAAARGIQKPERQADYIKIEIVMLTLVRKTITGIQIVIIIKIFIRISGYGYSKISRAAPPPRNRRLFWYSGLRVQALGFEG